MLLCCAAGHTRRLLAEDTRTQALLPPDTGLLALRVASSSQYLLLSSLPSPLCVA